MRWLALTLLVSNGCIYQELYTPHVGPGGTVTAALDGQPPRSSTGLGDLTKDPFAVNGYSPYLTFGLISPGSTMALKSNNVALDVTIPAAQLEIHADGAGCTGQSGIVHLHTDGNGNLGGDFTVTGLVTGGTDACGFSGTLDGIPLNRE